MISLCLVIGGIAGGGAYLLTREDSPSEIVEASSASGSFGQPADDLSEGAADEFNEGSASGGLPPIDRGFPTNSKEVMRADIESLMREFHLALVDGDYRYAWSLLTQRKRQKEQLEQTYSGWRDAQSSLTPYLLPSGAEVQIDDLEDDGVARVLVTGMGWTDPRSVCSEWSGLTWVRYEHGAWRYDPGYSTVADRRRRWQGRSSELLGVGC